jgi:HEAT repeat protein
MQIPSKKLVQLLQPDQAIEVRCAAALILGELGARDAEIGKALTACLLDAEHAVRLEAIKAVGKIRVEPALPHLLDRLKEGGEEGEQAAHAAAQLGSRGAAALQELMPRVAPGLRRYIAAALASGGPQGTEATSLTVLLDKDPGVVEAAVRSLMSHIPSMNQPQRKSLADQLLRLRSDRKKPLVGASESAVVRLLACVEDARAAPVLWDSILPPHPPEVRIAALQALGKWAANPSKDQLKRLFTCAADSDFRLAAPALVMLKALAVNDRSAPEWLSLLQAPDVAVRQLAIEKVGDRDTAEVAAALLDQVRHPDRSLREAALARLSRLHHGQMALTKALLDAESPEQAWLLARAQAPFAHGYSAAARDKVFAEVRTYLQAGDRRAEALLFLLREADAGQLRDRLEEQAQALRKKKDFAGALLFLRLLTRDPACGFPIRLEQAACGLKVSGHDLAAEARAGDPCLPQFANLCQHYEKELVQEITKIKWLEPEELFYLGFDFAEREGSPKRFAAVVLKLLLKRSPRSKLAQAARSKMRSAGLED